MQIESFISKITHPELLDDRSLSELDDIIKEYPFFQAAHLLRIKNLHNQGSIVFDRELKKTAVWITDRRKLFYLLDDRVLLDVDEEDKIEKIIKEETDVIDFASLTQATELAEEYIEEEEQQSKDELDSIILSGSASLGSFFDVEDKVDLDDFKNTFKKTKPEKKEPAEKKLLSKQESLIDSFIKEKPKIIPIPETQKIEQQDISAASVKEDTGLMTDTLAKIYIKQGHYEKAILTYEKLSLKYPEKKAYFAGQIQNIKQISNNK